MEGSFLDIMRQSSSPTAVGGGAVPPRRVLPERSVRAFALQVVLGLELLHNERGIIHRDIKPANLLFHRGGAVKIADFGVSTDYARAGGGGDGQQQQQGEEDSGQTKTFVGSVLYMSPERLQGQPYGASVDVWSLGVTLYEAAVGKHPFQEEGQPAPSFWELLQRVAQQDPLLHSSPLREHGGLGESVSEDMDSFVALCLAYDPEERPTATELLAHPWLQSLSLEDSESVVAEAHTARQTATAAAVGGSLDPTAGQQQQLEVVGVPIGEGPQALQCSALLVGGAAVEGGVMAAGGGGGGGVRRQRGDALLSEFVASYQQPLQKGGDGGEVSRSQTGGGEKRQRRNFLPPLHRKLFQKLPRL